MSYLVTLWWLLFFTALGLCIGSFLNAVIYRLPRQTSLRSPRWSLCPTCRHRIQWFDNLPILSFFLLRGRCRHCGIAISARYLVIEAGMAVLVLMILDAFFIGATRDGLFRSSIGVTEELVRDWPIFLAHIVLFACLLPMSAIDLEFYWVDVRFTNFAAAIGFVLHSLWTPKHSATWFRPSATLAVISLAALAGLIVMCLIRACRPHEDPDDFPVDQTAEPAPIVAEATPAPRKGHWLEPPSRGLAWLSCALLALVFAESFAAEAGPYSLRHAPRAILPLVFFFFLIVRESTIVRASDEQIATALETERPYARRMVLRELAWFLPAIGLGLLAAWLASSPDFAARISETLSLRIPIRGWGLFQDWMPLRGLATAATGFVLAGTMGWAIRIVFTLILGKEAFGTGDIHLMAATGCVAGWPVVFIGFLLTCILALLGWVMALPFKRPRALPLGPWLSLSFLIVVVFYRPISELGFVRSVVVSAETIASILFSGG